MLRKDAYLAVYVTWLIDVKNKSILVAALLLTSGTAFAGIPVDEEKFCPVGGEKFTITSTISCTTFGKTMSFRQISSCEFVTKLPVCPSNLLPVYKEFSQDEISRLTTFVETPKYSELKSLNPWLRAYYVSQFLEPSGSEDAFNLLLSLMWYESEIFFDSAELMDSLLRESEHQIPRAPEAEQPFLQAILAYALSKSRRLPEAQLKLQAAKKSPNIGDYLKSYIKAIEVCQPKMDSENCLPNAPFRP